MTTTVPDLLVTETFGPTLQGEGPSCGQQIGLHPAIALQLDLRLV